MKQKYLFIIGLVCIFNACIEDTGNYDYTSLQEVAINGLDDTYRFVLQKPYSITPDINTRIDEKNLAYCWRIGADTLCQTKELNHTFTRIPSAASTNPLTFEVLDKTTDVRYSKRMPISIVSPFTTGWLMLTSLSEGGAQLAFQSFEAEKMLYQDVYEEVNGEKLTGTPLWVKQLNYSDGATGAKLDRVSIICENGKCPELDGTSLVRNKFYEDEFRSVTPHICNITSEYYTVDKALNIVSDGLIYGKAAKGTMDTPDDAYYQYPFEGDDKGYHIAPYIVAPTYSAFYFALDELNHRFVVYKGNSLSSKVSSITWDDEKSVSGIDLDDVPGKMVWMGAITYDEKFYSIILNDGKYILRHMDVDWDGTTTLSGYAELPDGVIAENSSFALHPTSPYMFVSNGQTLKIINLETLSDKNVDIQNLCVYDGEILAMHYAYGQNPKVDQFGIAIQTGNNESALLIVNPELSAQGEILERYEHVEGKIVSLCRKAM